VLSNSILLGFPYADVEELGAAALVVADADPVLAQELAAQLALGLWELRRDLLGELKSVEAALDEAASLQGPVCLLDMGDNVGGGSPGDGTVLIRAIHQRRGPRAFASLADPEAAGAAKAAGIGGRVKLRVGGKTEAMLGAPLEIEVRVLGVFDVRFEEAEARHGGYSGFDPGLTAVVESDTGLTLQLTSNRVPPFSLSQLTACGLDPASFHILVAKGVHAPIAAYRSACRRFIRADTPGPATADPRRLEYHHRRRPLWPFEEAAEF
jgi:microcystin degradation protein MlrC